MAAGKELAATSPELIARRARSVAEIAAAFALIDAVHGNLGQARPLLGHCPPGMWGVGEAVRLVFAPNGTWEEADSFFQAEYPIPHRVTDGPRLIQPLVADAIERWR